MTHPLLDGTFIMSDQPECCRWCGTRTEILEDNDDVEQDDGSVERHQLHQCPNPECRKRYWVVEGDPKVDEDGLRCPDCDSYRDSLADQKQCHHCGSTKLPS